ncbi:extracellular solute-binding protein [Clostridium sp. DJ247]|uniref:extracellular solute-binding protein n=1 Tax=Clostridium sp. DJ247 TaxID=2726188 RepID=UPI00162951D2|nr:extracellular solute-binding protein [Clostridium sp. DJ247]MBC2581506.1 extracellular solute-binding protein [Clostridium sp. DJ247]
MKKKILNFVLMALTVTSIFGSLTGCKNGQATSSNENSQEIKLNVATAGDTNMSELQQKDIGPNFIKEHKNVKINVVGTGPGDAGSNQILNKLKAQKNANSEKYDIDVAIVHQSAMESLMKEGLLLKYVDKTNIASNVVGENAKNSLGTNIDGYAIPLFQSQVAIAYNPEKVKEVPKNFDDLEKWIKANPKRFGYNGVKNGMSGVGFTTSYIYAKTGKYEQLSKGPYDKEIEKEWPGVIKQLKSLPVVITNGNNGTLDMLNRGEIDMGPVWIDMFYSWQADGRLNPKTKVTLLEPGLTGQPMYIVVSSKAANKDMAIKYAEFLASPKVQAKQIVEKFNWYPGIDPSVVLKECSPEAQEKLFKDITPENIKQNSKVFPLPQYLKDITSAYEQN